MVMYGTATTLGRDCEKPYHLREAMPFDNIEASMQLKALYRDGLDLWFEYHRVGTNGEREKLAVGEHQAALVSATGEPLEVVPWPEETLARLERVVGRERAASHSREIA